MSLGKNNDTLALVTGATGFIGGALVRRLLRDGYRVRALARAASPMTNIPASCAVVTGDLTEPESLTRAVAGVDVLFHVAADYRLWTPDPQALLRANVEGAENIMRAAQRAGVRRIVHTSSVATLAARNGDLCDETRRLAPGQAIGAYKRSKILAELLVERMVREEGLPAVIVCPAAPLGPGDVRPTPTGRIICEALAGRMPAYVDTGLNIVHVDDVADGHLAALQRGALGERYILGGENLTLRDMLAEIAALTGGAPPRFRLPYQPLMPLAYLNEVAARLAGYEPFLNRDSLRMSATRMFFDDSKARAALGYRPRPAREAIAAAVRWFRDDRAAAPATRALGDARR